MFSVMGSISPLSPERRVGVRAPPVYAPRVGKQSILLWVSYHMRGLFFRQFLLSLCIHSSHVDLSTDHPPRLLCVKYSCARDPDFVFGWAYPVCIQTRGPFVPLFLMP